MTSPDPVTTPNPENLDSAAPDTTTPDPAPPGLIDPDTAQELDDPYVHTVSTQEFVEAVETASREKAPSGETE
ncbi:hypothetical protein [Fibrella aquatica]|uniref:hypothetical protein n=1 Tax=Fibrella aquatica TaxID=3242487 RepID=UPI0035204E79